MGRGEVQGLLFGGFAIFAIMTSVLALSRAHARRRARNAEAWATVGARMQLAPIAGGVGVRGRLEGIAISAWYAEGEVVVRALCPDRREEVEMELRELVSRAQVEQAQVYVLGDELTLRWSRLEVDPDVVERCMRAVAACGRALERGYRG